MTNKNILIPYLRLSRKSDHSETHPPRDGIQTLGDKISGSKRLLLYRGISLESRRLLPDILSPSVCMVSQNGLAHGTKREQYP